MKKLLLLLPLILCSCDAQPNFKIVEKQGHIYIYTFPAGYSCGIYIHDPDCPKCKAALKPKEEK